MPKHFEIDYTEFSPKTLETLKEGFEKFESESSEKARNAKSEAEFWEHIQTEHAAKVQIERIKKQQ